MTREEFDLLRERYRQIKLLYCGSLEGWSRSEMYEFQLFSQHINEKLTLAVGAESGCYWDSWISKADVAWNANHPVIRADDVKKRSEDPQSSFDGIYLFLAEAVLPQ